MIVNPVVSSQIQTMIVNPYKFECYNRLRSASLHQCDSTVYFIRICDPLPSPQKPLPFLWDLASATSPKRSSVFVPDVHWRWLCTGLNSAVLKRVCVVRGVRLRRTRWVWGVSRRFTSFPVVVCSTLWGLFRSWTPRFVSSALLGFFLVVAECGII